jgi:hypothetical protein
MYGVSVFLIVMNGATKEDQTHNITIIILYILSIVRSPLWSSGRSSISGFDFQRYQIFWKVMGLERGPLSLVSIIKEYN